MQPDDIQIPHKDSQHLARRQLLKLGAAGMPMVLTLKASAREVLVSQLRCLIVMPSRRRVLIDSDGNAWIGTRRIDYVNGEGYKTAHIKRFKEHQNTVYFGSVGSDLSDYIPAPCSSSWNGKGNGYDYGYGKGKGDCHDYYSLNDGGSTLQADATNDFDALLQGMPSMTADGQVASVQYVSGKGKGKGDDCDEPEYVDCGYNYFTVSKNSTISPADYLTNGGNWNYSGSKGLYVGLLVRFDSLGMSGGDFPGISCVQSILQYLNQN
jgi:hypothetical protein